jgi:hypothetical protein
MNGKVIELQRAILEAQQQAMAVQNDYFTVETKARELEAECMRLKDWSSEKENYSIREIASGTFAYVHKDFMGNFQSAHKYCCTCFECGKKSMLQQTSEMLSGIGIGCPSCDFKAVFHRYFNPNPGHSVR